MIELIICGFLTYLVFKILFYNTVIGGRLCFGLF